MKIRINNVDHVIAKDDVALTEVIAILKLNSNKGLAMAIDNKVISKKEWDSTLLKEGNSITVIKATQGG